MVFFLYILSYWLSQRKHVGSLSVHIFCILARSSICLAFDAFRNSNRPKLHLKRTHGSFCLLCFAVFLFPLYESRHTTQVNARVLTIMILLCMCIIGRLVFAWATELHLIFGERYTETCVADFKVWNGMHMIKMLIKIAHLLNWCHRKTNLNLKSKF